MTIPKGICSYCQRDWSHCMCDNFHPIIEDTGFKLEISEIRALLDYFINRAGYISHEFDEGVFRIIHKMEKYEKGF